LSLNIGKDVSIAVSRIAIVGICTDLLPMLFLTAAVAVVGKTSAKAIKAVIIYLFILPILLNIDRLSIDYSLSSVSNLALYHLPASKLVGVCRP